MVFDAPVRHYHCWESIVFSLVYISEPSNCNIRRTAH